MGKILGEITVHDGVTSLSEWLYFSSSMVFLQKKTMSNSQVWRSTTLEGRYGTAENQPVPHKN